jgi:hypothetical protein
MDKQIRNAFIIGGVLALVGLVLYLKKAKGGQALNKKSLDPKVEDPELHKNFKLDLIPDGKGNYRSAQLTATQLPYVIKKYGIKRIIRMNGDGRDSQHRSSYPETPRSVEEGICRANGCEFKYVYSASGYKKGQGFTKSIDEISKILDQGNTLIHCAHGADRTGGMVGAYLKNRRYMTDKDQLWEYTTKYNGWKNMIKRGTYFGSGYDKYADGFYPIDELKAKYSKK